MNRVSAISLVAVFASLPLNGRAQGAAAARQPELADFIGMKSFPILAPISLSPDGKYVAYTIQDGLRIGDITDPESIDERPGSGRITRGCEVWVADIENGTSVRISDPQSSSWAPMWSPSGEMLAYFSDSGGRARPWLWHRKTQQANPLAEVRPQIVDESDVPRWSIDGKSIFFRAANERTVELARRQGPNRGRSDSPPPLVLNSPEGTHDLLESKSSDSISAFGVTNTYLGDLVAVRVESGEVTRLSENRQVYTWWPSPDGTRIAFTVGLGYQEGDTDWTLFDIVVRDLASGRETIAAHEAQLDNSGSALSWSPDGSRLAYCTMLGGEKGTRIWIWRGEGSKSIGQAPTLAYPEFPLWNAQGDKVYAFSTEAIYVYRSDGQTSATIFRAPEHFNIRAILASASNRIVWSDTRDGDSIYVAERNTDSLDLEVHRLDLSKSTDDRVLRMDVALALLPREIMESTGNGHTLVFPMESPQAPQDLWVVNGGFSRLRQITHINPNLEHYTFPTRRLIHWVDFDGHSLRGTVLLPSGYVEGKSYPLIVYIYGGERESRWANQFSATSGASVENMQLFATHGYAALVADTWMGTESPMLDLFKSLMPAIDQLIASGLADRNAIGVMGHSYGGYSVYSLLVQTNLFRAGVALSASGNLLSDYSEMDPSGFPTGIAWAEKSQGRMRETPWNVRDKYIENSPFFYLDRVQTPILIAHGNSDWHPAYEDREMFVGLRRLGKTAEYAEYYGGGHRIPAWRYRDQIDLANRVLVWFDRYLRPHSGSDNPNAASNRRSTIDK
jgi:dipeptidyl aminopeptidase/acylaminoacyl peptidase